MSQDSLEKSQGEGSRGGKVIGHTKSGKPIYDTHYHESHKNFNAQDHRDAEKLNERLKEDAYSKYKQLKEKEDGNVSDKAAEEHSKHLNYGDNAYYHNKKGNRLERREYISSKDSKIIEKSLAVLELAHLEGHIDTDVIKKARSQAGVYTDTHENCKLGRVGQKYKEREKGEESQEDSSQSEIEHKHDLKEGDKVRLAGGELQRVISISGNTVRISQNKTSDPEYVHITKLFRPSGEAVIKPSIQSREIKNASDHIIRDGKKINIDILDPDSGEKKFKKGDKIKFGSETGTVGREIEDDIHEVIVDK